MHRLQAPSPETLAARWPQAMNTLIISGEHDFVTPACVEPLAQALPLSKLVVLPGTSHMSHLEDEAAFEAAVRSFLEGAELGRWIF